MLPYLYIGEFIAIPMFMTMLILAGIAFILTMYFVLYKKEKVKNHTFIRMLIISIVGMAILGFSAFFFNSLFHSIEEGELKIGGITWLGGVLVAFPCMLLLIHKFVPAAKGNALTYFSLLIPGLALAHGLGRLGCFCAGCCYGGPTDSIFGVCFPKGSHAAHVYPGVDGQSVPLLPTQLIEAVFEFSLFFIMIIFYKKLRKHNVELYCFAYGLFRFLMEFLRGDDRGSTGFFLTPSQFICVILWIWGVLLVLFKRGLIFKKLSKKCEIWRRNVKKEGDRQRKEARKQASLDVMEALKELKELYDEEVITEAEYNEKKEKLLSKI